MDVLATTKYARMSPAKVGEVTRMIHGKRAGEALELLRAVPRKSARLIEKTLNFSWFSSNKDNRINSKITFSLITAIEDSSSLKVEPEFR